MVVLTWHCGYKFIANWILLGNFSISELPKNALVYGTHIFFVPFHTAQSQICDFFRVNPGCVCVWPHRLTLRQRRIYILSYEYTYKYKCLNVSFLVMCLLLLLSLTFFCFLTDSVSIRNQNSQNRSWKIFFEVFSKFAEIFGLSIFLNDRLDSSICIMIYP